ncbi:uncharacterized protein LOC122266641 [Penaeus japonicus]|uniref:uncharacterized protein LOC122266641 n=1 Tax=Penaeus japonicus TaxID=27405 RepID=UPI001C70E6E5|nr:uncharacterized protein LOC122266641 [Penaeus japonicus]
MRSELFVALSLGAALAAAGPVPSGGAFSPAVVAADRLTPVKSFKLSKKSSSAITPIGNAQGITGSVPEVEPADLEVLVRHKRNFYGRGDPWGRDWLYGRRRNRTGRRKFNRGRMRYFFERKKPRNNYGPDYENENSSPNDRNAGYDATSVVNAAPSGPRRSSGGFVSARSSGVAKVEQTG